MSLLHRIPLVPRGALSRQAERAERYKEWYASAMAMVDAMPSAVAWADPGAGFAVTYANPAARAMLATVPGLGRIEQHALPTLFPQLAGRLSDPDALPLRLRHPIGERVLDLHVVAVRDGRGRYVGVTAVWSDVTAQDRLAQAFDDDVGGAATRLARMAEIGRAHV